MPRVWPLKLQWVLVALLWLGSLDALAKETVLGGQVSHVTDGDSLWLTPAAPAAPVELRLLGIDAPEICQAWGQEAKQALAELVLHQQVTVKTAGRDTHGRTLGTVYLDTLNVNKTMVQEGHAWSTRYKYDRGPYVADERMAKALSRGLNREGGAIVPREFRRSHGACTSEDMPDAHATGASLKPPPSAPAPTLADAGRRCDGRSRCSQMRSCEEATWFLRHCPGVQMDGNHDGVPCERQWCRP